MNTLKGAAMKPQTHFHVHLFAHKFCVIHTNSPLSADFGSPLPLDFIQIDIWSSHTRLAYEVYMLKHKIKLECVDSPFFP